MHLTNQLEVITCHTGGVSGNVVVGGMPELRGTTAFAKKQEFLENFDHLRTMLLFEPRGGPSHSVNFLVPTGAPGADYGFLIAEQEFMPDMSGSNTICVATVILELGLVEMVEPVTTLTLESPAGLVTVECNCHQGKVRSVRVTNQPSFVYASDVILEVSDLGPVRADIVWGGMGYVIVDARDVGLDLVPAEDAEIVRLGELIKTAARGQVAFEHPTNPDYLGISQTEFTGELYRAGDVMTSRNAVVVSPGLIDRSACGTGTSARLALLHSRGEVQVGEQFIHKSIIGTVFDSRIENEVSVGQFEAVTSSFAGQAWITGRATYGVDTTDPFPHGYTMKALAEGTVFTRIGC